MTYYDVTARNTHEEWVIYSGDDYDDAQRLAVNTHIAYHGKVYVSVLLDGGTWRDVKHVPGNLDTARLTEPSCCLHPLCGQINPLSCYCAESMDAETKERYRTEYA